MIAKDQAKDVWDCLSLVSNCTTGRGLCVAVPRQPIGFQYLPLGLEVVAAVMGLKRFGVWLQSL